MSPKQVKEIIKRVSVSIKWQGKQVLPKTPLTPETPKMPLTQLQEPSVNNISPHPKWCVIPHAEILPEAEEEGAWHEGAGGNEEKMNDWKITDLEATPPDDNNGDDIADLTVLSLSNNVSATSDHEKPVSGNSEDNTLHIHFHCSNYTILKVKAKK